MNKNTKELRIPNRILSQSLKLKQTRLLRLLATAKLHGHRCKISTLAADLHISARTLSNQIKALVKIGWAGTDGVYLFPRSWRKLSLHKRGGLYITEPPRNLKRFESLAFAKALKPYCCRPPGKSRPIEGRTEQKIFPARYISKSLGLSSRRFERLKAQTKKFRFISVKDGQYSVMGYKAEINSFKKNLHGPIVFVRGNYCVTREPSIIRVSRSLSN